MRLVRCGGGQYDGGFPQRCLRLVTCAGSGQGFCPMERELVFDIDLTDYDDVRTCGREGHICIKCWPLMAAAIKVCPCQVDAD